MCLIDVLGTYTCAKEQVKPAKKTKSSDWDHITISEAFAINETPSNGDHTQPTPKMPFLWEEELVR